MIRIKLVLLRYLLVVCGPFYGQVNQYANDGTRHGLWEKKFEGTNQVRYSGNFDHGVEVGKFKFYTQGYPKQPSAIQTFSDKGNKSEIKYFAQNGRLISKGNLINKKREGRWEYYHNKQGKILMTENYKNNQLEGERISYYDNNQKSEVVTFIDGKKEGKEYIYTLKGVLYQVFTYKNGLLEGENKYYSGKGELQIEGNYKANKKYGVWKYYKNGKLIKEKTYK